MNDLIEALKIVVVRTGRDNQVIIDAIKALEAAERMAAQLDILVREGNGTLEDQEALTAYRAATQRER